MGCLGSKEVSAKPSAASGETNPKPQDSDEAPARKGPQFEKDPPKVLVIGDAGVGKTCFILRAADNTFTSSTITTTIEFKPMSVQTKQCKVFLNLYDTGGQERFQNITNTTYIRTKLILLFFDLTNKDTFSNLKGWIENNHKYAPNDVLTLLIGTKSDLDNQRIVSPNEIEEFANEFNLPYVETSSKTPKNVDTAIHKAAQMLLEATD